MKEQRFQTFDEFWPFYVRQHAKKETRTLHFIGLTAAMACAAGGLLLRKRLLLALAPVAGYGPAWLGHFLVEKNRPATFGNPLWSLRADIVMWSKMVAGTMDAEVARVMSSNGYHASEKHDSQGAAEKSALDERTRHERDRREREKMN